MKKNLLIISFFQILYGVVFFTCYFVTGLIFEDYLDIVIMLTTAFFLMITFILYKFFLPNFLKIDLLKKHIISVIIYFSVITVLSTVLSIIESDMAWVFMEILQQSYGVAILIVDSIHIEKNYTIIVFSVFSVENIIKAVLLLTVKTKKNVICE